MRLSTAPIPPLVPLSAMKYAGLPQFPELASGMCLKKVMTEVSFLDAIASLGPFID